MVKEQLKGCYIEESISPWNSPVLMVQKKFLKLRMITDLRAVNRVIQPIGPLQPGILYLLYYHSHGL